MRPNRELNEKHSADPQPGDYWSEMLCPMMVVVGTFCGHVAVIKKTISAGADRWTWDLSAVEIMKRDEFSKWPRYESIDGFWADVDPGRHIWVTQALESRSS
jgi:hypothetical protein